jgi:outer membrane protein assembly factor BamB
MMRGRVAWILGFAALLIPAARSAGDDWPQWRGPDRDGASKETGILEAIPAGGLKVRWRASVGPGYSSPVVARGRVYLTDCQMMRPRATERVHCYEEATGKPLWMHSYAAAYPYYVFSPAPGMGPTATPVVSAGKVYTLGSMGQLFCLDTIDGQVLWEKDLIREYEAKEFNLNASPVLEGDVLIVYVAGKPGACVVAFDKDSGKERWRALSEAGTNSTPAVITANGRRQLIVWTQDSVTSLDPATGKSLWRMPLATSRDVGVATPVCSGDLLLLSGLMLKLNDKQPGVSRLWPGTNAVLQRLLSNTSTPVIQGNYVFSARYTGELACLDARTGSQVWQTDKVTDVKNGASIHITPCRNVAFLYNDRGEIIRAKLTAAGYVELGRARLLEPTYPFNGRNVAWAPPAYANCHVFARSDRELVCASLEAKR